MWARRGFSSCLKLGIRPIGMTRLLRFYRIDQKLLQDYYEALLIKSDFDEEGFLLSSSGELLAMLAMSKNIEDYEVCIKALYNFKGNRISVASSIFDKYIAKSIEIGCPEKSLDIIDYHQYLNYYPHPETVRNLCKAFLKVGDGAHGQRVFEIVQKRKLLKINDKLKETLKELFEKIPDDEVRKRSAEFFTN